MLWSCYIKPGYSRTRSSCLEVFYKKVVLRNFAKFTRKHLCQSLFFKKRLCYSCLPVNFAKFLRTSFLRNTSGRLLLNKSIYWFLHDKKKNRHYSVNTLNVFKINIKKSRTAARNDTWAEFSWKYTDLVLKVNCKETYYISLEFVC